MKYDVSGTVMEKANLELEAGEKVFSEAGRMVWMTGNTEMDTNVKGGIGAGIGRMLSGESLFLNEFYVEEGIGTVTFAAEYPGKMIHKELGEEESLICQKDSFVCAEDGVELKKEFRKKIGAGFFGGEGFILQRLTGPGHVFTNVGGEVTIFELEEDQKIKVDTGCLGMFEPSVEYDIESIGGAKNMLFGGEGMFLATLTGPGKVWLQSMPISTLAAKLSNYLPNQ